MEDVQTLEYTFRETEDMGPVMMLLEGHVFHVTKQRFLPAIRKTGYLLPNEAGTRPSTFGLRSNSFFLRRGCVSLFDYRTIPDDPDCRRRCWPLQAAEPGGDGIAILFIDSALHDRLIPWTKWNDERAWSEVVVPYVEAGFLGPLPLTHIERVVLVTVLEDPNSLAAIVRGAQMESQNNESTR